MLRPPHSIDIADDVVVMEDILFIQKEDNSEAYHEQETFLLHLLSQRFTLPFNQGS